MAWLLLWIIALRDSERRATEATDWMKPAQWTGNYWGPTATRARSAGQLPPLPTTPAMTRWRRWGRSVLRDGDIVFRLGDARTLGGFFPLSRYIAEATGSPFSHAGVVAIEDGAPVVYDCASAGVQRQPFEVWMLDCVGAMGVKRLRPEHRRHIVGAIDYCREMFERQVPFDFEFHPDDAALYCLELTEKAFRSQGLALSQPVRIGDWEYLTRYPRATLAFLYGSSLALERPFTLDRPVYIPGNESQGIWGSPALETVVGPEPKGDRAAALIKVNGFGVRGDLEMAVFVAFEMRRSFQELPLRWISARISRVVNWCMLDET
jgi:hypothetical protein